MLNAILLIAKPSAIIPTAVLTFVLFKVSNGDQIVALGGNFWEGYFTMFAVVFPLVAIAWSVGTKLRGKI